MGRIIKQIPPAKALINGIRSIGYSFSTSVADIIDNSISANSTRIDIFSDPLVEKPYFIILDNGIGMNEKELINAMKFGSDRRNRMDGQLDLGRFGLGLKSASLSQCRELVVVSKCKDEINAMSYDLDIIEKTDDWNMIVLEEIEIKEHSEEGLDGVEERLDESELEEDNLNTVTEDELEEQDELEDDEFFTNILDEEDLPDDKIFKDLDSLDDKDE